MFQVPTLLGNDEWRAAVLPHLTPPTREFFTNRFPRLPRRCDHAGNEPDRPATRGTRRRGAARLAYLHVRRARRDGPRTDRARVPRFGSERDRLVANLLVYDLLHAARTRASIRAGAPPVVLRLPGRDPDARRPEPRGTAGADGEIRATRSAVQPEPRTAVRRDAQRDHRNRSHLSTTALNAKAAALVTREYSGAIDPDVVTQLRKYHLPIVRDAQRRDLAAVPRARRPGRRAARRCTADPTTFPSWTARLTSGSTADR